MVTDVKLTREVALTIDNGRGAITFGIDHQGCLVLKIVQRGRFGVQTYLFDSVETTKVREVIETPTEGKRDGEAT